MYAIRSYYALSAWTGSQQYESLESLFAHLDEVPSEYATAIRNNGGGTWNHTLFWQCLTPVKGTQPSKDLGIAIDRRITSYNVCYTKLLRDIHECGSTLWNGDLPEV